MLLRIALFASIILFSTCGKRSRPLATVPESGAMEYKGFVGSVHYSDADEVLHGKLEGIRDLVTYEGTNVANLNAAFVEAVEDYLATCKKRSGIRMRHSKHV